MKIAIPSNFIAKRIQRRRSKAATELIDASEIEDCTPEIVLLDVVDQYMYLTNTAEDSETLLALATEDCTVIVADMAPLSWEKFIGIQDITGKSFPDFSLATSNKSALGDNKISIDIIASGTHTGAPYGLANVPGCPAVAATGIKAVNDPETFVFKLNKEGNKIASMEILATGEKSGPHGLYMQVAGLCDSFEVPPVPLSPAFSPKSVARLKGSPAVKQLHKSKSIRRESRVMDPADQFIFHANRYDKEALLAMGAEKSHVIFADIPQLNWAKYIDAQDRVVKAFPDFRFDCSNKQVSGNTLTIQVIASGTHTGAPYGLLETPGFPDIAATGIKVTNDPETFIFITDGQGKIKSMEVVASSEKTGPQGLYMQVAGLCF